LQAKLRELDELLLANGKNRILDGVIKPCRGFISFSLADARDFLGKFEADLAVFQFQISGEGAAAF
jgi:hypothetical protein